MDDDQLWQAFQAHALAPSAWTHATHLRTAFLFTQRFAIDEAHLRMRAGIIRLNERHGLVETPERGYFETLTRVWLLLVAAAAQHSAATTSQELLERCPELLDRQLPLRHYTKERLRAVRARAIFLEPDLAPLPTPVERLVSLEANSDTTRE